MQDVDNLYTEIVTDVSGTTTLSQLEQIEIKHFGRQGSINTSLRNIKQIPEKERKAYGQTINEIKDKASALLEKHRQALIEQAGKEKTVDITLPGKHYPHGSLHMVSYAIDEISKIFEKIGFIRMSYREVEWEWFSFESLNMPKGHPARDDFETFFIEHEPDPTLGKMLFTPHTSSGQNREMKRLGKPPIRMINMAKTYRPNWDASHVPMFHQFEGLCVDKGINITHLKGTIDYFAKQFFGPEREIRLRPFHFQFTEPSFEVDITCGVCKGTGTVNGKRCKLCKQGWLELGGTGMVHPNVLRDGGVDPEEYSGWAFGFGVERVYSMKEGLKLDDIRILYNGDIRFLKQF
ncbi:phenylalanine--tRNA ligase subunit alpha [Candidatus Woesebacteria bacterium]|nr:phenylalanine--tRNA ligase subunit alpha [Candidatus Woesebacteria bacterium]